MSQRKTELEKQLKAAEQTQIEWGKTAKQFWKEIESQVMVILGVVSGISGGFLVDALNQWIAWTFDPAKPHSVFEGLGAIWTIEVILFGTVFFASVILLFRKLEAIKRPYFFALEKHKEAQKDMGEIGELLIQESVKSDP